MSYSEIRNNEVTVRKVHSCAWCAQRINVGEKAQSRAYVNDGDMVSDRMHPDCYDAMLRYPDERELNDGWMPGDFARGSISDEPEGDFTPSSVLLNEKQAEIIRYLRKNKVWSPAAGWFWNSAQETNQILRSLVEPGLVLITKNADGAVEYREPSFDVKFPLKHFDAVVTQALAEEGLSNVRRGSIYFTVTYPDVEAYSAALLRMEGKVVGKSLNKVHGIFPSSLDAIINVLEKHLPNSAK